MPSIPTARKDDMKTRWEISMALAIAITATACATAPGLRTADGNEPTCHSLTLEIAKARAMGCAA
jgi:hypothetical protein